MSKAESLDGWIEEVLKKSRDSVRALVRVPLKSNQIKYFKKHLEESNVRTDLFMTTAFVGINQHKTRDDFEIEIDGGTTYITYIAEFEKYLPDNFVLPSGEIIGLDRLLREGTHIGKLVVQNPELEIPSEEIVKEVNDKQMLFPALRKRISNRKGNYKSTIVLEPIILPDGTIKVPLFSRKHLFNKSRLSERTLVDLIDKEQPRHDLWMFQPESPVGKGGIWVGTQSGVLARTNIFLGVNTAFVVDDHHVDARVFSKHNNGPVFIGLLPGNRRYHAKYVHLKLYRLPPESPTSVFVQARGPVQQPLEKILERVEGRSPAALDYTDPKRRYSPWFSVAVVDPNNSPVMYKDIKRKDHATYRQLQEYILAKKDKVQLVMSHFPSSTLASHIITSSSKISELYFRHVDFRDEHFSTKAFNDLIGLSREGIDVYWSNPFLHKMMKLHGDYFVDVNEIKEFEEIQRSGKIAAFYGSAGDAGRFSEEISRDIDESVLAYKRFHGGRAGIVTGGIGKYAHAVMSLMYHAAKRNGLLFGATLAKIPNEAMVGEADFVQTFDRPDLSIRQEVMDRNAEVLVFHLGGFGTDYEAALNFVKKSLDMHPRKPMVFVGSEFYDKKKEWLDSIVKEGFGRKSVMEQAYFITRGADLYDVLVTHYQVMDKPLKVTA